MGAGEAARRGPGAEVDSGWKIAGNCFALAVLLVMGWYELKEHDSKKFDATTAADAKLCDIRIRNAVYDEHEAGRKRMEKVVAADEFIRTADLLVCHVTADRKLASHRPSTDGWLKEHDAQIVKYQQASCVRTINALCPMAKP